MQVLLSEVPGGPEQLCLRARPDPIPRVGEVRVTVRCVGINYPDTLIIKDLYQFKPERPFAPGAEFSGVVDMLGEGVTGLRSGDRVMALPMWGALAEKVCIAADRCHPIPDEVDFHDAAALQMTYGTALYALHERAGLRPGETVLVLGAAGGVGLAAVELAKVLGARVVAAASSDEKIEMALSHGADLGIVYSSGPLDRDGQKALTSKIRDVVGPNGADIIVDTVGGDYTEAALRCISWGGRFLIVGFPAGIARIPANLPLLKSCDIRGIFWGAAIERDAKANQRAMAKLLRLCAERKIQPRIHATYALVEGGRAIEALSTRGVMGKVLVDLS